MRHTSISGGTHRTQPRLEPRPHVLHLRPTDSRFGELGGSPRRVTTAFAEGCGRERAGQTECSLVVPSERQRGLSSDARSAARAGAMRLPPFWRFARFAVDRAGASCFQPRGVLTTPAHRVAIRAAEQRRRAVTARARNRSRAVVRGGPPGRCRLSPEAAAGLRSASRVVPRNSGMAGWLAPPGCGRGGLAT